MTGIGPSPGGAQLVHSRLSLSGGNRRSIGSSGIAATPAIQNKGDESASAYLALQDDEEERRQRQLSRLQQLQQSRTHGSPGADGTPSGKDKRRSVSSLEPRLTGQQLALHYTKCIQLSAENKINIKNAFNLQLIDFMTDMLKKKHSDMNNFQVASCTLDASTKIYAYRVDSVHTDTMRMAGGLGRTQHDAGHAPEDVDGDQPGEQIGKIKRKRTKKAATIESNPAALNLSSLDLEFIVDPLFKKIASEFDEGKAGGGLFLNALMLRDDGGQLLLDSEAVLGSSEVTPEVDPDTTYASIPPLHDLPAREICPAFSSFHFTSWKVGDDDTSICEATARHSEDKAAAAQEHAFDINAVPEPLVDDAYVDQADYPSLDDVADDDDDTACATLGVGGNNTCLTVGWGGQHAGSSITVPPSLEAVHLKQHLATSTQEYSYFDTRVMSAWAGPGHWKFKAMAAKDRVAASGTTTGEKKRKKDPFELNFRLTDKVRSELDKLLSRGRTDNKLTQYTIKKWCEANTTLPADLRFDPADFSKLHGRDELVVRREAGAPDAPEEEKPVDGSAAPQYPDEDDDGCQDNQGDTSGGGYDMTLFSQTLAPNLPASCAPADFLGDNLVSAPNKVAKINIGYARTAKRMDMKKLKGTVWQMLTPSVQDKENDRNSANVDQSGKPTNDRMAVGQRYKFSEVYRTLPNRLNASMAENLSFPLAFIALLHLCNEKNLALTPDGNLSDFIVQQD